MAPTAILTKKPRMSMFMSTTIKKIKGKRGDFFMILQKDEGRGTLFS
jgi:hypothetical protein